MPQRWHTLATADAPTMSRPAGSGGDGGGGVRPAGGPPVWPVPRWGAARRKGRVGEAHARRGTKGEAREGEKKKITHASLTLAISHFSPYVRRFSPAGAASGPLRPPAPRRVCGAPGA